MRLKREPNPFSRMSVYMSIEAKTEALLDEIIKEMNVHYRREWAQDQDINDYGFYTSYFISPSEIEDFRFTYVEAKRRIQKRSRENAKTK